ncbi:MAG: hypothetical protein KKB50_12135, partial [Planctomycetes bacterium]|nr:hypothetical protein [Planctomycetota bacterium]
MNVKNSGIVAVVAVILAAGILAIGSTPACTAPDDPPPSGAASAPSYTGSAALDYRGLAIQMQTGFSPVEAYGVLLREVVGLGADTVLLSSAGLMEHAKSQALFIDARKTPAPEDFKAIIRDARQLGLKVIVMPIILLSHPRGSEWRGVIEPPDWGDWWRQYREFVAHFADIARDGEAEAFIIGSELVSTEKQTAQWVKTIELAREHYPRGRLGYSANWDHYKPIQFWDKLDFVGMTSYYKLADRKNPTVAEIVSRWKPIRDEIMRWQRAVGKPIVLTEVGWCSQSGAALEPWNYYHHMQATPEGHEEQRRLYEAFLQAWDNTPGLAGIIWWEWTASPGGPGDYGYTPRSKMAEQVLRRWFAA